MLFQWHITNRCNLQCLHCYQEGYTNDELDYDHLLAMLEQFKTLQATLNGRAGKRLPMHINVTGGEPFVRQDFPNLLQTFAEHRKGFSFAILTNGTDIDAPMARFLQQVGPSFVQVSIEGNQTTHEQIRGSGSYAQTMRAIKHLRRAGIVTYISFTAHRYNYREFPAVVRLGQQIGADVIWADRLIPQGSGANLHDMVLTPEETHEFFSIMQQEQKRLARCLFNHTQVKMHRALQFLVAGGRPYHCTAGDRLVTIMPDGEVYPCRRMPISVGNMLKTPLVEIYDDAPLFQQLRDQEHVCHGCEECFYARWCGGGLRCLAYAITGDPLQKDPGCWK